MTTVEQQGAREVTSEALSREFLRVCEEAAIEAARTMGQGHRGHSDHLAVDAMRKRDGHPRAPC